MAARRSRALALALGAALVLPVGTAATPLLAPASVAAEASDAHSLDWVKAHATPQTVTYDTKYGEQQATVWVATLSYDSLSQAREIMLYGEVAMPISSQDVGVEEFDGRYYLPFETNSVKHNEYVRSRLLWSEEDPKGTYDKTVFSSDGPLRGVRGTSVTLTLGGVESTVSVPQETAVTDTHELEEAMTEHWSTYSAAVDAGMLLDETTKQTYLSQDAAARALVTRARAGGADAPTNADIQAARTSLNTAFDALTPAPYDRTSLTTSLIGATTLLEANGKDGRRLTRASYDTLVAAVATGQKLLATPDAVTLKAPREGELVTHRDFDDAVAALDAAVAAATTEDYTPVDTTALDARYDAAIARVPAEGKGFTPGTRAALMSEIATAATLRDQAAYATADQVSQEVTALEDVMDALVEEPLGEAFTLTVRYQHPMEGAPSDLIHEYFNDAAGNPVEEQVPVHRGQEMRYPLTDETLIKSFEGYTPRSFHLNSDDGTLGLVQVLTDSKGVRTVAFRADTTSPAGGGSLDIRYVAGQDTRVAPSPTPGPETPADPGTGTDQAAAPAVDPAVGPSAGAAPQAAAQQGGRPGPYRCLPDGAGPGRGPDRRGRAPATSSLSAWWGRARVLVRPSPGAWSTAP